MTKLQEISKYLLDNHELMRELLFEIISLSRRLCHLEYEDKLVSCLDAEVKIDFLSPIAKERDQGDFTLERVEIVFMTSRHNPIILRYVTTLWGKAPEIEEVVLLDFMDCLHMEGYSYGDLEGISWLIQDRLLTLSEGNEISNIGILNTAQENQYLIIKSLQERVESRVIT